jgi:hypothetical protein
MRLNALYLIGTLTISAIPLSAGAVAAQPAGAVPAQSGGQTAVSAPRGTPATQACPSGYYWESSGYAKHGKFRPAHCARRW